MNHNTAEAPSQNPILPVTKITYKTTSVRCKTITISCDATKLISKTRFGFTNRIWKQSISMLLSKRRYLKHMAQGSRSKWISVNLRPADSILYIPGQSEIHSKTLSQVRK